MAKKNIVKFREMKKNGEKIVGLTAYDFPTAALEEQAGVDLIEVGDSLGICVYGYPLGTVPVTLDQSIAHAKAVRRGAPNTFVIGDMPFLSYQISPQDAVRNAGRYHKEAGVDAVTLEGGRRIVRAIRAIVEAGMVACGTIGLPETDGNAVPSDYYKDEGRTAEGAHDLIMDARALQDAGASLLILGPVPMEVARFITEDLWIPVIGIGAGQQCDGQILIVTDVLGIRNVLRPQFTKRYANFAADAVAAIENYARDVKGGRFPEEAHSYHMIDGEELRMRESARIRHAKG